VGSERIDSKRIVSLRDGIIEVYNILGRKISTLVDETKSAGGYHIAWDGDDSNGHKVSTGLYFYRFQAGDFVKTKKILLLK